MVRDAAASGRVGVRRGRVAIAIGALAGLVALALVWRGQPAPAARITLTAGFTGTSRALVAAMLAESVTARGTECRIVEGGTASEELAQVGSGAVDFALVPGIWAIHRASGVHVVAPMHVEALHLLVKQELATSVDANLAGLEGRTVDLGPLGSETAALADAAIRFAAVQAAGKESAGDAIVRRNFALHELEERIEARDREALPDAIFHLGTVPSRLAWRLAREADYRLVPLPFAEAFRLAAILASGSDSPDVAGMDRRLVSEARIPAYLYRADPAVPPEDLPTIGARLVLVAHERVSDETVARVLDAALHTRVAHMLHPSLDRSSLIAARRHGLHRGTLAFLAREEPAITGKTVDELNNTLGVLGALVGGAAFLVQGSRQRRRARIDALVASELQRVAAIERRIVEIELAASLDLGTLMSVQRELLERKSRSLDLFTEGQLGDHAVLANLLAPIDSALEHAGDLLLHLRARLEHEPAGAARALWSEAAERSREEHGEAS